MPVASRVHAGLLLAPFPELPPELVHVIFHHAARWSTEFCLTLCRVSSWTRRLALPHLYSTVILKNHGSSSHYIKRLSKPPLTPPQYDFHPKTVLRSLWNEPVSDRIVSIFEQCDDLVHMALHPDNLFWLFHASSSSASYRRLSHDAITRKQDLHIVIVAGTRLVLRSLTRFIDQDPSLITPLFSQITHLRLARIDEYETDLLISQFTRLTHLAVPFWLSSHNPSMLDRTLNHQSLEVLVVVIYVDLVGVEDHLRVESWFRERKAGKRVFIVDSTFDGLQKEWEEEVRGGKDLWSVAVQSAS
jgi:hypothetical protein